MSEQTGGGRDCCLSGGSFAVLCCVALPPWPALGYFSRLLGGEEGFSIVWGVFWGLQISTKTEGSLVLFGGIPASIMWSSFLSVLCACLMSEPIGLWACNDYRYDLYDDSMA